MLQQLIFTNSLGAEVSVTRSAPFLIQSFDTSNNINIYKSKGVLQDGATYLGNTLDVRDISLGILLRSDSNDGLIGIRKKLTQIFNPKLGEGTLTYIDETKSINIKCIPSKIPYFTDENNTMQSCLVNLTCNNPYWQGLTQIKTEIALWVGSFSFPLNILESGIEMGHREPSVIVNVLNEGDVPCGMRVEFKALATLTNPSILNVNTYEYIKINKTMVAGEVLSVTTHFGGKKVESSLNGVITNAFNYIDIGSEFLQLDVGDNLFRYDSDTGTDNLECSIWFIPQYLGV